SRRRDARDCVHQKIQAPTVTDRSTKARWERRTDYRYHGFASLPCLRERCWDRKPILLHRFARWRRLLHAQQWQRPDVVAATLMARSMELREEGRPMPALAPGN